MKPSVAAPQPAPPGVAQGNLLRFVPHFRISQQKAAIWRQLPFANEWRRGGFTINAFEDRRYQRTFYTVFAHIHGIAQAIRNGAIRVEGQRLFTNRIGNHLFCQATVVGVFIEWLHKLAPCFKMPAAERRRVSTRFPQTGRGLRSFLVIEASTTKRTNCDNDGSEE